MKIKVVEKGDLFINEAFLEFLDALGLASFDDFMRLEGSVVKSAVRERSTQRLNLGGNRVYVKKHFFPGIREITKNLLRFRLPVGALNEWQALLAFHSRGIPTMTPICAGRKLFLWRIEKESFLLTDDLGKSSRLDDFLKAYGVTPCRGKALEKKRRILKNLADITREMHSAGLNHKDFYLCHILVDSRERLYIIDLHRVDVRNNVGKRWKVKDLAALLFSSLEVPLTHGERLAFYKRYTQINRLSAYHKTLIRLIIKKCNKIAQHTQRMYENSEKKSHMKLVISGPERDQYTEDIRVLLDKELPSGWEWVASSTNSVVARRLRAQTVYYKEFLKRSSLEGFKSFVRGSRCQRAIIKGNILRQRGFHSPVVHCWGKKGNRHFMISEGIDALGLGDYIRKHWQQPLSEEEIVAKRRFIKKFGKLIGELHKNGICHGDLQVNNALVHESEDNVVFYFVDNERNYLFRKIPRRFIRKNLVQINMIQSPHITRQDRLRFFRAYCEAYGGLNPAGKSALIRTVQNRTAERLVNKAEKEKKAGLSNT